MTTAGRLAATGVVWLCLSGVFLLWWGIESDFAKVPNPRLLKFQTAACAAAAALGVTLLTVGAVVSIWVDA